MVFIFDGVCKSCGKKVHFALDSDHKNEIAYAAKCHFCQNESSETDCERLYHLMDTLETLEARNGFAKINGITIN